VQGYPQDDAEGMEPDTIDDDIVVYDSYGAERVPDLSLLPEDQWLDALRPLSRLDRIRAQNTVSLQKVGLVGALIGDLIMEEGAARARARAAPPARLPLGDTPPNEPRRQVNFRLGEGEHARLGEAARLFGMRPNVLARVLVVRGVDRALRDARRDA
jgi:hypothetical protein